jgi:hypothetical protein
MKKLFGAALLALLVLSGASAQAAYDSAKVKDVMHINFGSLRAAKAAIDATDSKAAADAFNAIATADAPLLGMDPPKGSRADWDAAFTGLIATAKKGAAASVAGDWTTAKAALADLRAAMGKGHAEFRS